MKKILVILAAAFLGGGALMAGPVSPGQALEIGRSILQGPATRATSDHVSICWDGEYEGSTAQPAFYVVARDGGGFVIISADDNVRPVLAISENGRFDTRNMPDNVKWWMERMKAYVRSAIVPTPVARVQWARVRGTRADDAHITGEVTDKHEILTPEWDQGNNDKYYFDQQVFNRFCPVDASGELSVTGCVATALSEILTTLSALYPSEMPVQGTGTVGGYSVSGDAVAPAAYTLSATYDWEGFRTLTGIGAIRQAIADGKTGLIESLGHLLADCGAIVGASYSSGGTGAGTETNVTSGMAEHMFMSKTAHSERASSYTHSQWTRMLKEELDQRPLLYSGQDPDHGGHAFVFDGYGKYLGEDVFHVNFGWAGSGNGYYFCDYLDSGNGNYSNGRNAIFSFYPDASQRTSYSNRIVYYGPLSFSDGSTGNGLTALGEFVDGQYTPIRIAAIMNMGNLDFDGTAWIYRMDRYGNRVGDPVRNLSFTNNPLKPNYYSWYDRVSIRVSGFSFGDRLAIFYPADVTTGAAPVKITASNTGELLDEIPLVPAAFIKTETSYAVGDCILLQLLNYGAPYAGTQWTFTAPDGTVSRVAQSAREFRFTQAGRYKVVAAIAPTEGADVVENVVAYISVQ